MQAEVRRMTDLTNGEPARDTVAEMAQAAVHNEAGSKVIRLEGQQLLKNHPEIALGLLKSEMREDASLNLKEKLADQKGKLTGKLDEAKFEAKQAAALAKFEQMSMEVSHHEFKKGLVEVGTLALNDREVKKQAFEEVNQRNVRDVNPHVYAYAERRARREAMELYEKGDVAGAMKAKGRELFAHEAYRAASDAKGEIQDGIDYSRQLNKPAKQERLHPDTRDQINAILMQYDFRRATSDKAIEAKQRLSDYLEKIAGDGMEVTLSPEIRDAMTAFEKTGQKLGTQDIQTMKMNDFRGLVDGLKNLEKIGINLTKIERENAKIDLEGAAKEARETWSKQPQAFLTDRLKVSKFGEIKDGILHVARCLEASLTKIESMCDILDGGDSNGPANTHIFRGIAEATGVEKDMQDGVTKAWSESSERLADAVSKDHSRVYEAGPDMLDKKAVAAGLPVEQARVSLDRKEFLALIGIRGDAEAFDKECRAEGWDQQAVLNFLDRHATKDDYDFIHEISKSFESVFEKKKAVERDLGKIEAKSVAKLPFDTPHGTYPGWYWPISYDVNRMSGERQAGEQGPPSLFERMFNTANATTGREITRVKDYAAPQRLSLDALPGVISDEIHYVTHQKAIVDAWKFIHHPEVAAGIRETLGHEYHGAMENWLKSVANDSRVDAGQLQWMDRMAHGARINSTMVGVAFRASTEIKHSEGAAMDSLAELGPKWAGVGLKSFVNPGNWAKNVEFMRNVSSEMKLRFSGEVERDVRDSFQEISDTLNNPAVSALAKGAARVKAAGMQLYIMGDLASASPTWMGAYAKALASEKNGGLGMEHEDAVYFADKSVRNAHGGGGVKDLAAIQRGGEIQKLFTMYYSFWNHNINRVLYTGRMAANPDTWKDPGKASQVVLRSLAYVWGTQAIHNAWSSRVPKAKSWLGSAAQGLTNAFADGIPVVRDVVENLEEGKRALFEMSPVEAIPNLLKHLSEDAINEYEGKHVSKYVAHDIADGGSYLTGFPMGGAVYNAGEFIHNYFDGSEHPQDAQDWFRGITTGHVKETRHEP